MLVGAAAEFHNVLRPVARKHLYPLPRRAGPRHAGPVESVPAREELWANVRGLGLVAASSPGLALSLLALTVVQGAAPALVVGQTGRFLAGLPEAVRLGSGSAAGGHVRSAMVLIGVAVFVSQLVGPLQQAVLSELEVAHWIGYGPVHTLQFLSSVFQQLAQLVAMAVVAATYAGWVPLFLVAVTVPVGVAAW